MPRGSPRPVTIYDVARAAGFAPSTVSRAFSRPGRVNSATAEHIREVAASLGYRANPLARALSTARSGMIGLVMSDVTNPFHGQIIRGVQAAATPAGYTIQLTDTQESEQLERLSIERALPALDGLLLASSRMSDSAIRMLSKHKPVIVLNRAIADVPCVVIDNRRGVRRAAEHLAGLGHESITYVAGPEASWADGMRWRSLLEVGSELDLRVRRIGPYRSTISAGVNAARKLRQGSTTAVLAFDDQLAIGVMRGLAAMDVNVPDQVSVIGFDNTPVAELVTPRLTTIASPLRDEALTATRNLLAMIGGAQTTSTEPTMLPTRLIVRESTAQRL